tara:strand:- start:388 stop:912 length:525 start_codon:yes stop_codon:yes gene_type:complete
MSKKNKYYTPAIEEFHFGFEYYYNAKYDSALKCTNGKWRKVKYLGRGDILTGYTELKDIKDLISKEQVRVKHLNRENIENFGFTYSDMIDVDRLLFFKDVETYKGLESCGLLYVPQTNWVLLYTHLKQVDGVLQGGYTIELPENKITVAGGTRFCGEIKNKSELKCILTQTGIL